MKNLPRDIKKHVKRKIVFCIALFLILEIFAFVFNFLFFNHFSSNSNATFHIILIITLHIFPFFISGFPFKLIDHSWNGKVVGIDIQEEGSTYFTSGGGKFAPYTKSVIYLTVKKSNDKEIEIPIREFGIRHHKGFSVPNEGKVCYHQNDYTVGDEVYHFYGLKNYYVVKQNSDFLDCIVCGTKNHSDRTVCVACGFTLIK